MNQSPRVDRLALLSQYLQSDPNNTSLLRSTIEAALAANQPAEANRMLDRLANIEPLTAADECMRGLAAIQARDYPRAAEIFSALHAAAPNDHALKYNLAWALAGVGESERALALLDDETIDALPQAAALRIELLHAEGQLDQAVALSTALVARHPDHAGLLAAASVLAIDTEDLDAAAAYADRAGNHPDAVTTRGVLALLDDRAIEAEHLFAEALTVRPNAPRALIGKGLTRMLKGEHEEAAEDLTRGAEIFGSHIGSWIGAGWARLIANDTAGARSLFERALALDPTFAESQGSLAVIDLLQGNVESAKRGATIALRLDPTSFSAALALALLANAHDQPERARAIIERALNTPIDARGRTIAQSLARLGLGRGSP